MRPIPIICLVVLLVATRCTTLKDQYDKIFGAEDRLSAQELAMQPRISSGIALHQ